MKKNRIVILLSYMAVLLFSCNLSDFDLNRYADPTGLNPVIYRPFTAGTYAVKDFCSGIGVGTAPFTKDSLNFNPITYSLDSMSFNTAGTDSMVVIIKTVNETPMKFRYWLSFKGSNLDSGEKSRFLPAAILNTQGDVIEFSKDSLEFRLDETDMINLKTASQIDLNITLYQPNKGTVLSNILKPSQISFYIGFRAPINLFKIKI